MKKKWIFEIGIFLLLTACTLNSTQEKAFNQHLNEYVKAINNRSVLVAVSKTYPPYVKYIKAKGTEFFKSSFAKDFGDQLGNSVIQTTKKHGGQIHILVQLEIEDGSGYKKQFAGISDDNGVNWFFMPYNDYKNKKICPELKRLL